MYTYVKTSIGIRGLISVDNSYNCRYGNAARSGMKEVLSFIQIIESYQSYCLRLDVYSSYFL